MVKFSVTIEATGSEKKPKAASPPWPHTVLFKPERVPEGALMGRAAAALPLPPPPPAQRKMTYAEAKAALDAAIARRKANVNPAVTWEEAKRIREGLQQPPPPPKNPHIPPTIPARNLDKLRNVFSKYGAPDSHDLAIQYHVPWRSRDSTKLPWLAEKFTDLRRLFTYRGRNLLKLKKRLKEQIIEARVDYEWLLTYLDERAQGEHMRQWFKDEHDLIDEEIMTELRAIYPYLTDAERRERMASWSRDSRRKTIYQAKRTLEKLHPRPPARPPEGRE